MAELVHHKNGGSYTLEQLDEEAVARAAAVDKPAAAEDPAKALPRTKPIAD